MADNKQLKDAKSDKPGKKGPPPMPMRGLAISFLMMAVFLTVLHLVTNSSKSENEIDYSTFMQMLDEGKIAKVEISHDGTGNYYASMESKEPSAAGSTQFRSHIILTDELMQDLNNSGVQVRIKQPNTVLKSILVNILPFILIFGIIYFIFIRQMKKCLTIILKRLALMRP